MTELFGSFGPDPEDEDPDRVRRARRIAWLGLVAACVVFVCLEWASWATEEARYLMLLGIPLIPVGWRLVREIRAPRELLRFAARHRDPAAALTRLEAAGLSTDLGGAEALVEVQDALDRLRGPDTFTGRHPGVVGSVAGGVGAAAWLGVGGAALATAGDLATFVIAVGMAAFFGAVGWTSFRGGRARRASLDALTRALAARGRSADLSRGSGSGAGDG